MSADSSSSPSLDLFHPAVRRWFTEKLGTPTDVQDQAWPAIAGGDHVLVTAPTGCGKTLAAFLWALDRLLGSHWPTGSLQVLYISPLKALNNDVQRNLLGPLQELERYFLEEGTLFPRITVLTRSGDTPEEERRKMRRQAPEILITTPESLHILLTQKSAPSLFRNLKTVIVDEIHALAGQKRGTLLNAGIERMAAYAGEFQRIGLSATVNPPEAAARYLGGLQRIDPHSPADAYRERPVQIIRSLMSKAYAIEVRLPTHRPPEEADKFWESLALELKTLIRQRNSTLIFTNSRRSCEKLARLINENEEELLAYSHHGSLSRELRLEVEQKLKNGELKALVATNSLELGIDIGDLDEVILAQTPRSAASAIQKTGRAGHRASAVSRAVLYPSHGIDFLEAAVITDSILHQKVEPLEIPEGPLDVLAQVVLSALCCEALPAQELYLRLKGSWSYRNLGQRTFGLVLDLLSGRYEGARIKELKPRIDFDPVQELWKAKDESAFLIYSSGGTIPDRGYFTLRDRNTQTKIGELDEEFVWERQLGDRFALGSQVWRLAAVTDTDVLVEPIQAPPQIIPFWKADDQDRSYSLSREFGRFLEAAEEELETRPDRLTARLEADHGFQSEAAVQLKDFLLRQKAATGRLPHRNRIVAETVVQDSPQTAQSETVQIILHTFWGGRVNRPWAFALAQAWEEKYGYPLEVYPGDAQILFLVPPDCPFDEVLTLVKPGELETRLRSRLESTGYFGARFRECAGRSLLLPKIRFDSRQPLWLNRLRSKRLLDAVLRFPDFPILLETWRQCLNDEFELETLTGLVDDLLTGKIEVHHCQTREPSPFSDGLLWRQVNKHMYEGDEPDGGKHSRLDDEVWNEVLDADRTRLRLPRDFIAGFEAHIQQTAEGYAPETVQDLFDLLELRIAVPPREWITLLDAAALASGIPRNTLEADLAPRILTVGEGKARKVIPRNLERLVQDWPRVFLNWLDYYGPVTADQACAFWQAAPEDFHRQLQDEASRGELLLGHFTEDQKELELCRPGNWEHLVRRFRQSRREAVQTRPLADLPLFLAQFQGLVRQASGMEGLQDRLEQLFALPLPAAAWESTIFPSRLDPYHPAWLDSLIQNGGLRWQGHADAQVSFLLEGEEALAPSPRPVEAQDSEALDHFFQGQPSAEFSTIVDRTGLTAAAVTEKLFTLAWKGLVAHTSFEVLRKGLTTDFRGVKASETAQGRRGFQRWAASRVQDGSWYRLTPTFPEDSLEKMERLKDRARWVLDRYGIVFRELLQNEAEDFQWRRLFPAFKLMELSGEITGGLFFEGLPSLQFASAQGLRLMERLTVDGVFVQHAQDPSSLCGVRNDLFPALPRRQNGNWLWWTGTTLAAVLTSGGKKLEISQDLPAGALTDLIRFSARLLLGDPHRGKNRWDLETINQVPAAESPWAPQFCQRGFQAHGPALILWRS